jgi:hypothetical protein
MYSHTNIYIVISHCFHITNRTTGGSYLLSCMWLKRTLSLSLSMGAQDSRNNYYQDTDDKRIGEHAVDDDDDVYLYKLQTRMLKNLYHMFPYIETYGIGEHASFQ